MPQTRYTFSTQPEVVLAWREEHARTFEQHRLHFWPWVVAMVSWACRESAKREENAS